MKYMSRSALLDKNALGLQRLMWAARVLGKSLLKVGIALNWTLKDKSLFTKKKGMPFQEEETDLRTGMLGVSAQRTPVACVAGVAWNQNGDS